MRTRLSRIAGSGAILALLLAAPAPASSVNWQKIALEGDPAPGTEPGTLFHFQPTYLPLVPRIDENGHVGISLFLQGPSVTADNASAVWTGAPGALELVARAGEPAPDVAAAVVFDDFPAGFELISPGIGSGVLGFTASLTGDGITTANDDAVWRWSGGQTSLVAREGDPAPGVAGAHFVSDFFGVEVSEAGALSVTASLGGPGVTTESDQGFWTDRSGSLELFLREGDSVPGQPSGIVYGGAGQYIGTGYTFQQVSFNPVSRFSLESSVTGPGVDTYSNETILAEPGGVTTLLAREGDPAPGAGSGVTFGGNGVSAAFGTVSHNALGQSAFTSRLGGSVSTQTAMFSNHTGTLQPLVMPGDEAPDAGEPFGPFGYPVLSDGGRVAFRSALASGGFYPPFGMWWDQPGDVGKLSALVLPGQPFPGDPDVTILGAGGILEFTADGLLAFQASLDDPANGFRSAILLAEPGGSLSVAVARGDVVDVHGDGSDLRVITDFDFGGMTGDGTLALRVDFSDGTSGFFLAGPDDATDAPEPARGGAELRLSVAPSPFRHATSVRFELPRRSHVTVDVVDVAGRRVQRLLDEVRPAGAGVVAWNGLDDSGRRTASGVYFLRATTDRGTVSRKAVRLP